MDVKTLTPTVIVIPQTKSDENKKIRTAAYARVSSDSADQQHSFITQMDYYKSYISKNADMIFVDMYADEAVTGTRVDKRDDFNRMMQDARDGKIDLILTKSASRFARNTFDGISAVRELKSLGVHIVFEENGLDTRKMRDETELIAAYSIAQEESISTANNVRMGMRFRMRNGTYKQGHAPYGFTVSNGMFTIIPEEAEIVRLIFMAYKEGKSMEKIADELTEMDIPKKNGSTQWYSTNVRRIIMNVRYKGDALLQKTYTTDFPFRTVYNKGELDMYYIKNANPPIVSAELFDTVTALFNNKSEKFRGARTENTDCTLRKLIYCTECGSVYRLKKIKEKRYWVCRRHNKDGHACESRQIAETEIYTAFVSMYNRLVKNKEYILGRMLKELREHRNNQRQQFEEVHNITEQIAELTGQVLEIERLNRKGYFEPVLYYEHKNTLSTQINTLKNQRKKGKENDTYTETIKNTESICKCMDKYGAIDEFNDNVFKCIVKRIYADSNTVTFSLINDMNLKVGVKE